MIGDFAVGQEIAAAVGSNHVLVFLGRHVGQGHWLSIAPRLLESASATQSDPNVKCLCFVECDIRLKMLCSLDTVSGPPRSIASKGLKELQPRQSC